MNCRKGLSLLIGEWVFNLKSNSRKLSQGPVIGCFPLIKGNNRLPVFFTIEIGPPGRTDFFKAMDWLISSPICNWLVNIKSNCMNCIERLYWSIVNEPIQCHLLSKTVDWCRFRIVRVPLWNICWGTSRPMRSQHSELSTNENPRFWLQSQCSSNLES